MRTNEPDLFNYRDEVAKQRAADTSSTRCEQWQKFHRSNPIVMTECVNLARHALDRGWGKIGFDLVWARLRWSRLEATGRDGFKLNNNYRARYARAIMTRHPTLAGVFETRRMAFDCAPGCPVCAYWGFRIPEVPA